ncbi:MAG: metallophosphoesterase [Pseudomonadota bacterium]|nr:metallophosphoesterase [Pseudomonadota bacterium]
MPTPQRIVAIGDLHGDHRAWRDIAAAAGLVDRAGRWTGGRTIVVQTGDVVDRGPDSLKIIRDLRRLQSEARRTGGKVIALVGNHEAMNITGDLRYVHPGEYAAFRGPRSQAVRERYYSNHRRSIEEAARRQAPELTDDQIRAAWEQATPLGMIEHRQAWHPAGEVGAWVIRNPAVVKLGDLLFVHGGLGGAYAALSVEDINRRVAAALSAREQADSAIINDPNGPLWYRGLVSGNRIVPGKAALSIDQELTQVLRGHGARAIIIGHTPSLNGIVISHAGRLVRIDTGISEHYGGSVSYLEIIGDRMIPRTVERSAGRQGAR